MPQNDRFGRFTTTFMILLTLGLVFYLLFGVTPAKGQSAARGFDQTAMDATLAIRVTTILFLNISLLLCISVMDRGPQARPGRPY